MSRVGFVTTYRSQRPLALLTASLLLAHIANRLYLELAPHGSLPSELAGLSFLSIKIAAPISFLAWLFGVYRNLPALGSRTKRTAWWAVGFWFVPGLNVWHGYVAVRTAWIESFPEPGQRRTPLVGWWWALFLLSFTRLFVTGPDVLSLARTSVEVLASGLAAIVVLEIDARQRDRFEDLADA
jgi:hypothetical protein